jgi:two-component system sensor histidine kinase KdpD
VLVFVDGSRESQRAVRRAAALAGALHAAFVAVIVHTPESEGEPFDRTRDTRETIDDAVDLGADVVRIEADDVVSGLAQVSRSRRATHLVIPHQTVRGIRRLVERPLADQLIERLPELEVHVVGATPLASR